MSYGRIRDLREDADLSQRQIAEIIHMHKTTYTRYESGEWEVPLNVAILLAKHYSVSLDYLAGLTNRKGQKEHTNPCVPNTPRLFRHFVVGGTGGFFMRVDKA